MLCGLASLAPDTSPEKAHAQYQGTSHGGVIGLVHLLALEGSLQLPLEEGGGLR